MGNERLVDIIRVRVRDPRFALRAELQNPRFAEPGSRYGYYRSYSRGPAYPQAYPPRVQRGYRSYGAAPYLYEYEGW